MFKHILVPLDGSQLAEAALPAAMCLAKVESAQITLIHVIEKNAPEEIHGERHLRTPEEAIAYLDAIAGKYSPSGLKVERHVHTSEVKDVARSIVEHTGELSPDLIVMCTHGRGGFHDWLFGNIAQQIISMGDTPVLLIRPEETPRDADFCLGKILVPVDGLAEHGQGLPVAADLAAACKASLHLLFVVPTRGTLSGEHAAAALLLPGTMNAVLNMSEMEAKEYLKERLKELKASGIEATSEVKRGDPAAMIVEAAGGTGADLVVLATHGKSGMDAFFAGSVATKISNMSHRPLLLVPVGEK